jgi:hypothetical protein
VKNSAIVAISIVAVVAIVGIVAGVAISNQALEQQEYQRTLQESISSKSESQSPSTNGTKIVRNMNESVEGSITQKP